MSRKAPCFSLEKLHRTEVIFQIKKSRKQIIEYNKGAQYMEVCQGQKPTEKKLLKERTNVQILVICKNMSTWITEVLSEFHPQAFR